MTLAAIAVAAALALRVLALRRRLDLVARAEHEIRGPAAALMLAVERMRREPAGRPHARALDLQLARLRAALADLSAARRGRLATERPARLAMDGRLTGASGSPPRAAPAPVVEADPGRVAQALGNLLDNAAEHGEGPVSLEAHRVGRALRLVVSNAAPEPAPRRRRGRGLGIAREAARRAGGRLELVRDGDRMRAELDIPLAEDELAPAGEDDEPPAAA